MASCEVGARADAGVIKRKIRILRNISTIKPNNYNKKKIKKILYNVKGRIQHFFGVGGRWCTVCLVTALPSSPINISPPAFTFPPLPPGA